jgi:hypothetical protein
VSAAILLALERLVPAELAILLILALLVPFMTAVALGQIDAVPLPRGAARWPVSIMRRGTRAIVDWPMLVALVAASLAIGGQGGIGPIALGAAASLAYFGGHLFELLRVNRRR